MMKKIILNILTAGSLALLLVSCSSVYDKHVQWQSVKPETFPVLHAIGQAPISLQNSQHETQRMLMAINASKLAAYAELAEQVYGQKINGEMTMSQLIMGKNEVSASVQGVIRAAKVIKSYPVGDSYTTELSLDFEDVYNIYLASSPKREIKAVTYY
ncbi:MAG: hypothetical protein ACI9O3_000203 [Colwellia sp.]|jgi:hypothetical protein|nr:LPP20 family lipoprotein [Colwellia sp. MB3u-55]